MSGQQLDFLEAGLDEVNIRLLELHGMLQSVIPTAFQGCFNCSQFDNWLRARLSVESIMASAVPALNASLWQQQHSHQ